MAKPAPAAYEPLLEKIQKNGDEAWFAAAHMWDVSAAKRTGYVVVVGVFHGPVRSLT